MNELRGRGAILTGASYGVGPHIARALAREGVNLALAARSVPELERLAAECTAAGVRAVVIPSDLTKSAARADLVTRARAELGEIDILVNNAGVDVGGPLPSRSASDVETITQVNLVSPMELTRLVLPDMLERRTGSVVHVASIAGKVPLPWFAMYTASKYGVVGFNHALQLELHGTGVRSTAVCPGFLAGEGLWARAGGRSHWALGTSTPEQVARAVVDAIRRGPIEIVVNPMPVRPVFALWSAAPRIAAAAYRLLGIDTFVGRVVRAQAKGGATGQPR
jgi:short-subunit dehydrogenase